MLSVMAGLMAYNLGGFNPSTLSPVTRITLRGLDDEQLRLMSAQTGISYELLKSQQRAEMASAGSTGDIGEEQLIPTVEVQLKSNPKKASQSKKAKHQNVEKGVKTA